MPNALGTLVDSFTAAALNTALWNASTGGGVNGIAAPGRAYVQVGTGYNNIGATSYDASGQSVYARVTPALAGSGGKQVTTLFQVAADGNDLVQITCTPGTSFQAQVANAGTYTTVTLPAYDPTAHAWWRLRESGGSWDIDASADGFAWTTLATLAYSWSPADVGFYFLTHTSDGTTGASAYLEHVNTHERADGLLPSWPQVRFQVAFNTGGPAPASTAAWVDLSSRMRGSWTATQSGRQYELDAVQSGTAKATLDNLDGAFDTTNTNSPYSPYVLPFKLARFQALWPPTRNQVPQPFSSGTGAAQVTAGTLGYATGLAPAPTGHTTAHAWTVPNGTAAPNAIGLGASNASFATVDPDAVPVVAGQTYSLSAWTSAASGGSTIQQLTPRISWYDLTGTRISTSDGTPVTVPVQGAWAALTLSAAAPAGAVSMRPELYLTAAPTATTTLYATAWQTEQATAPSPWVAPGVLYPLWTGYTERWQQHWKQGPVYGTVDVPCVDVLAGLSRMLLQPSVAAQLQTYSPRQMYAFTEPSGVSRFADSTGAWPARTTTASPLGNGGGSITAGNSVQGSGSVGSSGPVITFTNPHYGAAANSGGVYLPAPSNQAPPANGGFTRIICYRTTSVPASGDLMCLWIASGTGFWTQGNGSRAIFAIWIDSNEHLNVSVFDPTYTYGGVVTVTDETVCDGNWHMAIAQLSSDGTTLTVTGDGYTHQSVFTGDATPADCSSDLIGGFVNTVANIYQGYYQGDLAYATEIPTTIGASAATDLGNGFATGWAGESSGTRMARILGMAGYQGQSWSGGAVEAMGGADLAGVDAASALQLVATTEMGQAYLDPAGTVSLTGRRWRMLQTAPTVVFGEDTGNGEVPYRGDVDISVDPDHIYNQAVVTNQSAPGTPALPAVTYTDTTSQAEYFTSQIQATINADDPDETTYAARYLVGQYAQPLPRIAKVTVDASANPAVWAQILPLQFGTRSRLMRRPSDSPNIIALDTFVEHVEWKGDTNGRLQLASQHSPAAPWQNWLILASLHTTVAVASTAGTATVTLAALTGAANNPAAAVLVAGTQLTLSYGTANAETLTVKSVATTTAGYTSVAVTFTANTAFNHAAADTVCQPLPSGYQLPTATATAYPISLDAGATLSASGPRAAY